ncbi:response regulator [Ardenticatena maritima]|uniref:LuxR family transcriptional regulator n=3 Tax=Ardenticatena maritima TaxID=872965 RepID=A0A0N8GRS3_9CHLR|nr:response regulator [Ardenticatena maritima]KPL87298.1 LuxR family transcriptional regulator [Ardenticatena maritima]
MHNPVHVLVADDHEVVRAGIANALNEMAHVRVVAEVGSGTELFEALQRFQPNVLLLDIAMPHFDPLRDIPLIRQTYPHLKILVVSAYDDDMYVQGLLRAGVHGYHLKDQPLSTLQTAITQILRGERWLSGRLINKLVDASPPPRSPLLTDRQREILRLLQQGLDNCSIARQMGVSVKTVENHLTRLYRRLGVQSRLEAVHYVNEHPELLAEPVSSAPTSPPLPTAPPSDLVVLVVDDNHRYRQRLQRIVRKIAPGALVCEAASLAQAAHMAKRFQPRLALVDVVLGDESGIEGVRRIKQASPHTRVVLISAYPDREFHRSGIAAGAVAFLDKKDLDADALRLVIEDAAR